MADGMSLARYRAAIAKLPKGGRGHKYGARRVWLCRGCGAEFHVKLSACHLCGGENILYFASKAEARWYRDLKMREKAGEIRNLECQKKFEFYERDVAVFSYLADFVFFEGEARRVIDVKGFDTPVSALKRKLIQARYGIEIEVVK